MDLESSHDSGLEVQHLWVDFHRRDGTTCKDHITELREDRLRCQTCIKAVELEQWVVNQLILWIGLDNDDKALEVGCY